MKISKKEVRYVEYAPNMIHVGQAAIICTLDHPDTYRVSNSVGQPVYTSMVLQIFPNGDFETMNTLYRKAE